MARAWLFPGQGSQRRGMGEELFARFPDEVATARQVLGYSVPELCAKGGKALASTEYVQPVMFLVNALHARALAEDGPAPDVMAGHSLGELNALHAAGCFDLAAGLELVRKRGELMGACPPGAMMAVLGISLADLDEVLRAHAIDVIDVANHNLLDQIVVSGPDSDIDRLAELISEHTPGKSARLKVSIAAHSRYMQPAVDEYRAALDAIDFAAPSVPVIANVTAQPYQRDTIADGLIRQLTGQVLWWDTMTALAQDGVDEIVEAGPGDVLAHMWDRATARWAEELAEAAPTCKPVSDAAPAHHWVSALGDPYFTAAYGVRLPYLVDALPHGVSGPAMVRRLADEKLLGFLGTRGRSQDQVDADLAELGGSAGWGVELPAALPDPHRARAVTSAAIAAGVRHSVTSGWAGVGPELVRWRFAGGGRGGRRLLVRFATAEHAAEFLAPAADDVVAELLRSGDLTSDEAAAARRDPVATDLCAEPRVGDGTGVELLLPVLRALRSAAGRDGDDPIPVGVAGVGTPDEIAAAVLLGADFVVSGAVNQATPQARTSDAVKDVVAALDLDGTALAPTAELFHLGAREHVVRGGSLYAARAARLHHLYRTYGSLDDVPDAARSRVARDCFGGELPEASGVDARRALADVFVRYLDRAAAAAVAGDDADRLNWNIPSGPEVGAFNRIAPDMGLTDWRDRDVVVLADRLTAAAADLLDRRVRELLGRADRFNEPIKEPAQF